MTLGSHARALTLALGFAGAFVSFGQPAAAQNFAPVAIVNDQVITGYDVEQRALLNSVTQGVPANSVTALEELISDSLRLQAAQRVGIDPSPQEVRGGFDEISRLNKRDPNQMRSGLIGQGISSDALDSQIKAEVAWRQLIIRRYGDRARATDNDVNAVVGGGSEAAPGETEYLLTEMRFPIQPAGEAAAMAAANQAISQMTTGARFSDVARSVSKGSTALAGGDLGWVPRSKLSAQSATTIGVMNVDRVSPPFVDGGDVVIYGLRGTREGGGGDRTSYTLAQLVVGLAPNAPQAQADAALARATTVRSQLKTCADVTARASQFLPISGDLGSLTLASMPGPVREAVTGLNVGDISQPVRSNDGFHVLVVCDKTNAGPTADVRRAQVGGQLRAERLERYAQSLLRELKREAVIERR